MSHHITTYSPYSADLRQKNFTVFYTTSGTFNVYTTLYNLHSESNDTAATVGFAHNSTHVVHVIMEVKNWELDAAEYYIRDDGRKNPT